MLGRLFLFVCMLAVLVTACASQPSGQPAPSPSFAPGQLPALPLSDLPVPRSGSVSSIYQQEGAATYSESTGFDRPGDGSLQASTDSLVWAVYQFGGLSQTDQATLLTLRLREPPPALFLAVSNYDALSWDMLEVSPASNEFSIALDANTRHLSAAGNLYVAVLIPEPLAQLTAIRDVTLRMHHGAPPPVDLRAGDGTSQQGIELSWTDPAVTYADDFPAFEYSGVRIERALEADGPWEAVSDVPQGMTSYLDTSAASLPAGQRVYYRLRTVRDGLTGEPGVADDGYVDFAPLAEVTAPSQNFHAPVELELSADGSSDPDGGELSYEWDFEGDGVWETSGDSAVVRHAFYGNSTDAPTTVSLRVIDDEGNVSSTAETELNVYGHVRTWRFRRGNGYPIYAAVGNSIDAGGNQAVLLREGSAGAADKIIARFDSVLGLVWWKNWYHDFEYIHSAPDGSLYAQEDYTSSDQGIDRFILARFDAEGEPLWARESTLKLDIDGRSEYSDRAAVLSDGGIALMGTSYSPGVIRMVRFSSSGDMVYEKQLSTPRAEHAIQLGSVAGATDGSALFTFSEYLQDPPGGSEFSTTAMLLNTTGELIWQKRIVDEGLAGFADAAAFDSINDQFVIALQKDLLWIDAAGELVKHKKLIIDYAPETLFFENTFGNLYWSARDEIGRLAGSWAFLWRHDPGWPGLYLGGAGPGFQLALTGGRLDPQINWQLSFPAVLTGNATMEDSDLLLEDYSATWEPVQLSERPTSLEVSEHPDGATVCRFKPTF